MPLFEYKAAAADGSLVEGQADCADARTLARRLTAQGQTPIHIGTVQQARRTRGLSLRLQPDRLTRKDIDFITLEMATLLRSGLPLLRALETLARIANRPPVRELLETLAADIRSGSALSSTLDRHPDHFDRFYCNMVRAGESAGALNLALERLAAFRSHNRALREALVSSLIYPSILVLLAVGTLAVMLSVVVPRFTTLFHDAGQELPWLTQLVVSASEGVQHGWWMILALTVGAIYAVGRQWRDPASRERIESRLLVLPIIGKLLRNIEAARFTRTLATLLHNGVNLLAAVDIAKEVVTNTSIARGIAGTRQRLRQGEGLAIPLAEANVFPALTTHLLQVGEESGRLEAMLEELAKVHEKEVETGLKRLLALVEPLVILVIAFFITLIILAIVMAVIESNNLVF